MLAVPAQLSKNAHQQIAIAVFLLKLINLIKPFACQSIDILLNIFKFAKKAVNSSLPK